VADGGWGGVDDVALCSCGCEGVGRGQEPSRVELDSVQVVADLSSSPTSTSPATPQLPTSNCLTAYPSVMSETTAPSAPVSNISYGIFCMNCNNPAKRNMTCPKCQT
jgi:hypothetical protein